MKIGKLQSFSVKDLTEEQIKTYINQHVQNCTQEDLKAVINNIGGGVSDLQTLVTKVHSGKQLNGKLK